MSESNGGNGPRRPSQSRLAASANTPMAKTVALVVLALIIGIVMINIVGDGGSTAKVAATTTSPTTSATTNTNSTPTTTTTKHNSTTTTAKKTNTTVPASQLKLIVVNSGAPAGSGGNVSTALHGRGYTNQTPTVKVTWTQSGLTVHCQPGFDAERTARVDALTGIPNYTAKVGAFKTEPGVPSDMQCYVAIGAAT